VKGQTNTTCNKEKSTENKLGALLHRIVTELFNIEGFVNSLEIKFIQSITINTRHIHNL
jgi:hypothetical protein